jgi:hypothetical protein
MKDPEAYVNAFDRRWDTLDDYRGIFDRALAEVRQATEAADHSESDWRGPARAPGNFGGQRKGRRRVLAACCPAGGEPRENGRSHCQSLCRICRCTV